MWAPVADRPGLQRCSVHAVEFPVGHVCPDPGCDVHVAEERGPSPAFLLQEQADALGLPSILEYEKRLVRDADYWGKRLHKFHKLADEIYASGDVRVRRGRPPNDDDGSGGKLDPIQLERLASAAAETTRKNLVAAAALCTARTEALETERLEQTIKSADGEDGN